MIFSPLSRCRNAGLLFQGEFFMNIKAIAKGVAAGTATGLVCYALSAAGTRKKHSIRKNAGKAIKAAGSVIEDITSVIM